MARGKRDIDEIIRDERATVNKELEKIRDDSEKKIADLRKEYAEKQKELVLHAQQLEASQREARARMERETVEVLEWERQETQRKLAEIKKESEQEIQKQTRLLREEWKKKFHEMDARIREMQEKTAALIERDRKHAVSTIAGARIKLGEAQGNEDLKRFMPDRITMLSDMLNAAIEDYNLENYVPADGEATLMISECDRCITDAKNIGEVWAEHHAKAKEEWQKRRNRLDAMNKEVTIEAADMLYDGVLLRIWNPEGWNDLDERLGRELKILESNSPCTLEEIALVTIRLDNLPAPIEEEIAQARIGVVRYMYLQAFEERIVELIHDKWSTWHKLYRETKEIINEQTLYLGENDQDEQRIILKGMEIKSQGILRVNIEDYRYDPPMERREFLQNLKAELKTRHNGNDWVLLEFVGERSFDKGNAVCIGLDFRIPDAAEHGMIPVEDDKETEYEEPVFSGMNNGLDKTEQSKEV